MVVRLENPRLLGLGWLVLAFVSGGAGALLLVSYGHVPRFVGIVLSDTLVLLSFVLLHVSIKEMRRAPRLFPLFGSILLALQFSAYLWWTFPHPNARIRVGILGIAVSLQVIQTIVLLIRGAKRELRVSAWFSSFVLMGFIAINLFRTAVLYRHGSHTAVFALEIQKLTFLIYVATAMGIAFNFFWMTTSEMSFELERMASVDPLTRIYNRRVFRDWCEREIVLTRRSRTPFSLVMMDLDHFKELNDRFGHRGGDQMLLAVVEQMQDSIRGIDVLGRWGGEEFVALLPGTNSEAALIVAQRIRRNVEKIVLPGSGEGEEMRMTMSLGIATYRGLEDDLDEMFHRSDQALYRAKAAGRNQVLVTS